MRSLSSIAGFSTGAFLADKKDVLDAFMENKAPASTVTRQ